MQQVKFPLTYGSELIDRESELARWDSRGRGKQARCLVLGLVDWNLYHGIDGT